MGILIIDDSADDAAMLSRTLARVGISNEIRCATSCAEAQLYLSELSRDDARANAGPSVIFLDLKLSEMDGFELLQWIRAQNRFSRTLIVAFSGLNDLKSVRRAYSLGANTFLFKPARNQDLENLIQGFPGYWDRRGEGD